MKPAFNIIMPQCVFFICLRNYNDFYTFNCDFSLQDIKMKKMADLQLRAVSDPRSKQAIEKQIAQWDENLEKLYVEQYRLRCYMASLQGCELPNPKVIHTPSWVTAVKGT